MIQVQLEGAGRGAYIYIMRLAGSSIGYYTVTVPIPVPGYRNLPPKTKRSDSKTPRFQNGLQLKSSGLSAALGQDHCIILYRHLLSIC
jgi:hypothetical protein